jgi:hypothetical protein
MDFKNECCPVCGNIMIEDGAEVIKLCCFRNDYC